VTAVDIEVDNPEYCSGRGGVKIISTVDASIFSILCNGASGAGLLGNGYVNVGTCDSSVKISLQSIFRNGEFRMASIIVNKIAGLCNGQELKAILKIKSGNFVRDNYAPGDAIQCSMVLSFNPLSGVDANSVALTSQDCENITSGNTAFDFNDVFAEDISSDSRALLIQIAELPSP
jgi:hypothetical protein